MVSKPAAFVEVIDLVVPGALVRGPLPVAGGGVVVPGVQPVAFAAARPRCRV